MQFLGFILVLCGTLTSSRVANVTGDEGEMSSAMWLSLKHGNYWGVKMLLWVGENPDAGTVKNGTLIHPLAICTRDERPDICKLLISFGADVHRKITSDGFTWLHWAAISGSQVMVKFWIEQGIAIDTQDRQGYTPLTLTAWSKSGTEDMMRFLVEQCNADISIRTNHNMRAIDLVLLVHSDWLLGDLIALLH